MSLISLSIVYDYDNHDGKDYHDDHDNDDFHDDYENQPDHLFALGARGERSRFEEEAQINIVRPEPIYHLANLHILKSMSKYW